MATFDPDSLQSIAARQSAEFGRWSDEDYYPSHEEISYAMSLGKATFKLYSDLFRRNFKLNPRPKSNGRLD